MSEVEPLGQVAAHSPKGRRLGRGLDALGHGAQLDGTRGGRGAEICTPRAA
jgi:hypothetical protein